MFGRKKKEPVEEYQPATIEVDDNVIESSSAEESVDEVPEEVPSLPAPEVKPKPAPVKVTGQARIEASEIVNINGKEYYRFILLANKSIGSVGEVLPLD